MTPATGALDTLRQRVGTELGVSNWHEITQQDINTFAYVTGDDQWIHTDPERARASKFGGPIAHGYLSLALGPALLWQVVPPDPTTMVVNYGLNKVRFPAPVPVGSKIRLRVTLLALDDVGYGAQLTFGLRFEREGHDRPVCVAEALFRVYPAEPAD